MEKYVSKSIFGGIAIGKIFFFDKKEAVITDAKIADVDAEVARFEAAKAKAMDQLHGLYEKHRMWQ